MRVAIPPVEADETPLKPVYNAFRTRFTTGLIGSFALGTHMPSDPRSRLGLLVGLVLFGVGLAVAGSALGATAPLGDDGTAFVVSDRNVTLEHGDQRTTVVDDMSGVGRVEIERLGGGSYRVDTEAEQPVTDSERRRAVAIAKANASVKLALDGMDRYDLTVEPIRKLTKTDSISYTVLNATEAENMSVDGENETFIVSVDDADDSVTVDRDPTYVENEVVVRARDPEGETRYTATVNLENGTVVDVSDRQDD